MDSILTEGARRVIDLAGRLARDAGAQAVSPAHVLWALTLDESRASEVLAAHGVTSDVLNAEYPLPGPAGESATAERGSFPADSQGPHPPQSDVLRDVLIAARRLVGTAGRQAEIGTEYLLLALVEVASEVSPLLQRFGLGVEQVSDKAAAVAGHQSEPIGVDFHIAWNDRTADEHADALRILDAAANRAREGLRVVEDYLRFSLDDAHLTAVAKHCRHDLAAALAPLVPAGLIAARDTQGDVGTGIRTPSERSRDSLRDVLVANLKRTQEAVRTLEEFGKLVSPDVGEALGRLRYRLYTLEKGALQTESNRRRFHNRVLYLLVTEDLCHHGSGPAVREALANGVDIVQVREKSMPDRKLLEHIRRVREWTKDAGALCIVNDRPDLAVLADADGVHVGQDELPVREARRIVGPRRLVGVSTHTLEQARQAVLDGADYLGVGPVFPSGTKSFDRLAGLEFVRQVAEEITLPWFAIGGITPANATQVRDAGAQRIAVSGAICGSEMPGEAARELRSMLQT